MHNRMGAVEYFHGVNTEKIGETQIEMHWEIGMAEVDKFSIFLQSQ